MAFQVLWWLVSLIERKKKGYYDGLFQISLYHWSSSYKKNYFMLLLLHPNKIQFYVEKDGLLVTLVS